MGQIIADTNICIYVLKNDIHLGQLLDKKIIYISYITGLIKEFINKCNIINYSEELKDDLLFLRRKYNLSIPDAIIAATSFSYFIPLITADKSFRRIKEIETSIYSIS